MPHVETRRSENKKESKQRNETKNSLNFSFSLYAAMSYFTTICQLLDMILALHESHWWIPNEFIAKPCIVLMLPCRCNMINAMLFMPYALPLARCF